MEQISLWCDCCSYVNIVCDLIDGSEYFCLQLKFNFLILYKIIIGRALRSRPPRDQSEKQPKVTKKSTAIVKAQPIAKLTPCCSVELGEVVLCKMRGFCEWPAIVTEIKDNMIHVEFFGDYTTHKAAINGNFFKFKESYDAIKFNLLYKKKPLYSKAVAEAEISLGVPFAKSIFRLIED